MKATYYFTLSSVIVSGSNHIPNYDSKLTEKTETFLKGIPVSATGDSYKVAYVRAIEIYRDLAAIHINNSLILANTHFFLDLSKVDDGSLEEKSQPIS